MTKHLDPRFAKVVALMESTSHAGERANARKSAEAIAKSCGMTFEQAKAQMNKPEQAPNIFQGFDEWMEEREPGYKTKCAAQRSDRENRRLARRAAILERYCSEEAVLAPCAREKLLQSALGRWIKWCDAPFLRWTYSVDGCGGLHRPPHIDDAVRSAYPMPATFPEAMAELDYWHRRRDEIEDVLGPENYGDCGLDRPAEYRMDLVRDLVEHELPTATLPDLYARFRYYRNLESDCDKIEAALFRDLEAIVCKENAPAEKDHAAQHTPSVDPSHPSNVPTDAHPSASDRDGQIRTMLDANPQQSDRTIAQACKCSPTTVGKVRRVMGLQQTVRSVQRGGQMYQMTLDLEARA